MRRTAILHYHLFKNARTSVDQILKRHFQHRWVTAEFPAKGRDNGDLVADWILANPAAAAFSTHTAWGPTPRIKGVRIITLLLLRNPIDRIRSAYRFERQQKADTWGARLANREDRQCRNFQTHRLAEMRPGDGPELARAIEAVKLLPVVGLVEDFDGFLGRMTAVLRQDFLISIPFPYGRTAPPTRQSKPIRTDG